MSRPTVYFLIGPTAVGKTEIALEMAGRMQAEIISADSMQAYRGVNILTANPSPSDRVRVKHHLIDFLEPHEEWNVARFRQQALDVIRGVLRRGRRPLVVGGSGLYIRTLVKGIFKGPGEDKKLRKELERMGTEQGNEVLHQRLRKIDPDAQRQIGRGDRRRLIRALEVYADAETPLSTLKRRRDGLSKDYQVKLAGLSGPRPQLYRRADERVDRMLDQGLVDEVRAVIKGKVSLTLAQCIGLKEIRAYLDGTCTLAKARARMQQSTRHLVKKQLTWFRREEDVAWFQIPGSDDMPVRISQKILKHWGF